MYEPIIAKFARMAKQKPRRLTPDSSVPSPNDLALLLGRFCRYYPDDLPVPVFHLLHDGRMGMCWMLGEYSTHILTKDKTLKFGHWPGDIGTGRGIDFGSDADWARLIVDIRRLCAAYRGVIEGER